MSLYARALRYLARREYSRMELEKKLSDGEYIVDEIKRVLDKLEQQNFLSDERAAEQMVHVRGRKYGSKRLRYELQMKGIAEHIIDDTIKNFKQVEFSSAYALWNKKFGTAPSSSGERNQQIRYLLGKGFPFEVVSKVLDDSLEMDN